MGLWQQCTKIARRDDIFKTTTVVGESNVEAEPEWYCEDAAAARGCKF